MQCKTCRKVLQDNKGQRSLTGVAYSTLCDLALERTSFYLDPSTVHRFLSQDPSYLCKACYSAVSKYANLKLSLDEIYSNMMSAINPGNTLHQHVSDPHIQSLSCCQHLLLYLDSPAVCIIWEKAWSRSRH